MKSLGNRILDLANSGYHNRNDYPPYAVASWDDRKRWSEYLRKIADEILAWQPIATAPRSTPQERRYVLVRGPSGVVRTPHFIVLAVHDAGYRPLDPWLMVDGTPLSDHGWVPTEWMEAP